MKTRTLTLKRLAAYLITFLLVVIAAIWLIDWNKLDNYFVSRANEMGSINNIVRKDIVFVHLEKPKRDSEAESFSLFRQGTVKLLNTIVEECENKRCPKGVVLDIWFKNDATELENLKTAIKKLREEHGVPVYAAYSPKENFENLEFEDIDFGQVEKVHAIDLYNNYLKGSDDDVKHTGSGRYHTFIYPEENLANYRNDIYLPSLMFGDSVLIESLVRKVALDLTDSETLKTEKKREGSIIPFGPIKEMQEKTYTFISDTINTTGEFQAENSNNPPIDLLKNIVVVGDVVNDLIDVGERTVPGPYIITWALNDYLDNNSRVKLPEENRFIRIGQALFFALFTVMIFALLFKYVKRLQTKPKTLGVISFLIGLLLLSLYGFLMLVTTNIVISIGITLVAMLVAALLSWRFANKFLVTGIAEGAQKYDVFISYSHGDSDWVTKNVYKPLEAFRKPNGDKLNIFFDVKSIGIGEAFTAKYMWAIVDSKYFIPVMSKEYYGKNHCRNEMDLAYKRKVEKLLQILPIAFSYDAVPEIYQGDIFADITIDSNFIEGIKVELIK